ncbi:MAG: 3-dehydroquinate synthase II [Desulfatibacillaceae bacterium]
MKQVWVKVDPWNKDLVTTALEGGADAVMVPEGYSDRVRELGRITTIAPDGDLVPGRDVVVLPVDSMDDEGAVVAAAARKRVIVETSDWTIIPLENLIARGAEVVAEVSTVEDAKTACGILEHGVWGVLVNAADPGALKEILGCVRDADATVPMQEAEVMEVRGLGMGDRVCVDTCTDMGPGEGMLVGNASRALFLVHAESISNPYVAPRPFRVNAGPLHAYTRVPGGKTRYLSELAAGDEVLVADWTGKTVPAVVGRVKMERRPLLMIRASVDGREINTILQNAETIRLVRPDGSPVSVVALASGDRVLVHTEEGARHFGHKIEESISEK